MKRLFFFISNFLLLVIFFGLGIKPAYATQFNLIAPSGTLTRGQNIQFTITIDTENQSLTSTQIGMTYKTDVLQYVSTTPGDAFPTVTTDTQTGGRLVFTATNNNGFSGAGNLAVVTFKLIATAAGSTELCVLFNPATTPTLAPTTVAPTRLPKTGSSDKTNQGAVVGITFLLLAGAGIMIISRQP